MSVNDEKHVDWAGLKYYDSLIKQYVNDIVKQLDDSTASSEEVLLVKEKVEKLALTVASNQARIDELFNENQENENNIDKLFDFDKTNSENIREIQTRIEYFVTKKELADVSGSVQTILDDISELEKAVEVDHVTLENVRLALENVATEDEIVGLNQEIADVQQQLDDKADKTDLNGLATEKYVEDAIAAISSPDLSEYAKKSDLENLHTTIEKTYVTNETLESTYVTNTTLQENYVTNDTLVNNYTTTKQLESTYVTNDKVTEQIEKTVTEVIQEKVDSGEISVNADAINYDTW